MDISKLTKAPPGIHRELEFENLDEILQASREVLRSQLNSTQKVIQAREAQIKEAKERLFLYPFDESAKNSIIYHEATLEEWKAKMNIWQNQLSAFDARDVIGKAKKK